METKKTIRILRIQKSPKRAEHIFSKNSCRAGNRRVLVVPEVLPVQPDHVEEHRAEADSGQGNWQVPLPPQKAQQKGKGEPEADADEQHAGHDFRVGEGGVEGLGVHGYRVVGRGE